MKFDFLTDYMIPPGGYHAIELTVNWKFEPSLGGVVHWSTLDKSIEGVIYPYHSDPISGFDGLDDYVEFLAYRSFDASIVKNMHYMDIRVNSTNIWIKYSDEGGSADRDRAIIGGACSAMQSYDLIENLRKKNKFERRKSMPVHKDSMAALCYSDMLYSINVFNLKIKNVIFNDPATIVFWSDGSKTVVKCGERDIFDPEKGLAMAISKKFLGNKGNYNNEFKKWLPKEYEHSEETEPDDLAKVCSKFGKAVADGFKKAIDDLMG